MNHHVTPPSAPAPPPSVPPVSTTISCATCELRDSPACADCVVSYVLDHDVPAPLTLTPDEARAVALLSAAGLVPSLRHREAA